MIRFISAAFLICGLLVPPALGETAHGPMLTVTEERLPAGTQVTVTSYDEDTKTYVITPTKFPGEGDGTVTPQALAKAIKSLDLHALTEDPLSIVGTSHECDAPLDLMAWKD